MSPQAERYLETLLREGQPEALDMLITLQKVDISLPLRHLLWQEAHSIGQAWHAIYWDDTVTLEQNLQAQGVKKLRVMHPIEEMGWNARALYDPNTCEIAINQSRLNELMQAMTEEEQKVFGSRQVWNLLVKHEVFHHIEETKEFRVDEHLAQGCKAPVPACFRDIAAYAFANAPGGTPPCQLLDLYWMRRYAPQRLEAALAENLRIME